MHDDLPLIKTIAAGFTGAWLLGLLTQRLRLSPIVGYLLAGVLIGPYTPGFVGDVKIAQQLAEVGVILLMFGVGLHFNLKDLLAVKGVAIPGAIGQSLVATLLGMLIFGMLGFPLQAGAVLGMAMAVASTVVLMRVLMDADVLNSPQGHVAVGWLIVEDIFTVVLLVLIPVLGKGLVDGADAAAAGETAPPALWVTLGLAMLKLGALVAIVLFGGSRVIPWVLVRVARLRSRELFTLTILVFSIAIAVGSYYFFGASMALGAFLAGMVVSQSPVSHQAAADALPMRDAFAVLFFVSVGMLFDPTILVREPLMILAGLGIILLAKPIVALIIVAILGHSVRTALTVAIGLAQIGEFSFILAELAERERLLPHAGYHILVASAIISIVVNPLLFRSVPTVETWLRSRPALWRLLNGRAERLALARNRDAADATRQRHQAGERLAVVIGFGPVGRSVHRLLREAGVSTVVVDLNLDSVSRLNEQGAAAIFGDASHESILEQAGVRHASHVVLTLPSAAERAAVVAAIRNLNPKARILVRARYLSEREDLERAGATLAVFEEAEAAVALARLVLADTGVHREAAERKVRDLRLQLIRENMAHIRSQRVRSVMVPWTRVKRLARSATREQVLSEVAAHRFSRWPVLDDRSGQVNGYLLSKDLIAGASTGSDWTGLVRPLESIGPDDSVESILARMQSEGATLYLVTDGAAPIGMITLEDILEQVVGRIEDEYPHEEGISLAEAVNAGGVVLDLIASTRDEVIRDLAAKVAGRVAPGDDVAALAIAHENEFSTDLGVGIAVPHTRCAGIVSPVVVFGRCAQGVVFSPGSPEPVRLVFLLVTPEDDPEAQLALLAQVAACTNEPAARESLLKASRADEVIGLLSKRRPG
ncbi:MAG: cation:proton antiporter [Phycisphaeraceae bacterium]|nr:cation:proton antiporter [Phycisphaeraceae bacterium]